MITLHPVSARKLDSIPLVDSYRAVSMASEVVSHFYLFYHKMALTIISYSAYFSWANCNYVMFLGFTNL